MAGLGLALGIWCIVMLPSAYRFQEKFNGRREQRQQKEEQHRPADKPAAGNARFYVSADNWAGFVGAWLPGGCG